MVSEIASVNDSSLRMPRVSRSYNFAGFIVLEDTTCMRRLKDREMDVERESSRVLSHVSEGMTEQ